MLAIVVRALPAYLNSLPYAVGAGLIVALIAWAVCRDQRQRLQYILTALAFGAGAAYGNFPLIAGNAFMLLGGSGQAAGDQAIALAIIATLLTLVMMLVVGIAVRNRPALAGLLLLTAYGVVLLFFTLPVTLVRGG